MHKRRRTTLSLGVLGLAALLGGIGAARAGDAKPNYPAMAPIQEYRVASASGEVALARSAAPTSISDDAEVLVLGKGGYDSAVRGKNGFVCLVQRSWAAEFADAEFWNPKIRAPICFNPAAARTVVPGYLERTKWVLAGLSKAEMKDRTRAAIVANTFTAPAPGAMSFMMSKEGYLADAAGHWHPHLMFFLAHTDGAAWGADLVGSPVFAAQSDPEPITTFFVALPKWSDGTPAIVEH
jgi:hypothetical protein